MSENNLDDCQPWHGMINDQGYGRIFISRGRYRNAHVVLWEQKNGPVPDGLVLDHLCRNRACVNLKHLEPVTPKENTLRGEGPTAINARKTHCIKGHELSGKNLMIDCRGNRRCRTCQGNLQKEYLERKKSALTKGQK